MSWVVSVHGAGSDNRNSPLRGTTRRVVVRLALDRIGPTGDARARVVTGRMI